jgi:hypothetical protein
MEQLISDLDSTVAAMLAVTILFGLIGIIGASLHFLFFKNSEL